LAGYTNKLNWFETSGVLLRLNFIVRMYGDSDFETIICVTDEYITSFITRKAFFLIT